MPHLLLVDDDPEALEWLTELAKAEGFTVAAADSLRNARIHLARLQPDVLLTDLQLPDGKGIELVNDIESRDSTELAHRLRRGDLPESYIAPPEQRELRELVRYRFKLTSLRTSAKAQIHAVMAKQGILPTLDDMFGPGGRQLIAQMPFDGAYKLRVESLLELLDHYARQLVVVEAELAHRLKDHAGYEAIQAIKGVGPIMAAIFVAEIGDVTRFHNARHLCSWAGLTPSHRESDTKVQRGHITKQGNHLVRWAAIEAVARYHGGDPIAPTYMRVARKRGKNIGRVAAARKLLTLVYYGLRDGEIRVLAETT